MVSDTTPTSPAAILWKLVRHAPRLKRVVLLAVLVSLTEGFGIIMLVPILSMLNGAPVSGVWIGGISFSWLAAVPIPLLVSLALVLIMVRLLISHASQTEQTLLDHNITDDLRRDVHSGLLRAEWRWLAAQRSADHVTTLVTQIGNVGAGLRSAIGLIGIGCSLIVYGVAAVLLSWQTSLLAAGAAGFAILISREQRRRASRFGHTIAPVNRTMHRHLQESIAAIRLNKIVGAEAAEIAKLADIVADLRAMQRRYVSDTGRAAAFRQMVNALMVIGLFAFGWQVAHLSFSTLLPLLFIVVRLVPLLERLQACWQDWLVAAPSVAAANSLIEALQQVAEPMVEADPALLRFDDELRLDAVTAHFQDRDRAALDCVDLVLPARTTTAITGPSGAGKSTFADILMGLIEPDAGVMRVDGVAVSGSDRLRWRRSVAYVDQEARLRNGSIRSNLLAAAPLADEADLRAALEAAAAGFVLALPSGLDTEIGDNGVLLSGGERQRIALARALLGDPQLLILDEATNALDAANEAAIRTALRGLHGRKTIVIISHGTAMLEDADRVVRLENGRLVSASIAAPGQPGIAPG